MTDRLDTLVYAKPFLKWAGNKFRIINRVMAALEPHMDAESSYFEPFAGSGAIFLNIPTVVKVRRRAYGDFNPDLVNLFKDARDQNDELVAQVERLFTSANNTEDKFYALRDEFNALRKEGDSLRKSALFIYLNRHCFNGLCRYGPNGFNVPFGRYKGPSAPSEDIRSAGQRLKGASIRKPGDFGEMMSEAGRGDVIYADPPYFPLSATAAFTNYASPDGFDGAAQERLAVSARDAARRGAAVVISNHDVPACIDLYSRMADKKVRVDLSRRFDVQRFISAKGDTRGKAGELLAVFTPKA